MDALSIVFLLAFLMVAGYAIAATLALRRAVERIDYFEKWTEEFLQRLVLAQDELKRIDASGHFEADDEVGYFFKALKEIMQRLFEMGIVNEEEIENEKEVIVSQEELDRVLSERRKARRQPK